MTDLENLTSDLPDSDSARRFLDSLTAANPSDARKLLKNEGLLSDVLTLAAYSPLLTTTLLQNPEYLSWLNRKRRAPGVRTKEELLEAIGRFVLTHSQLDLHTQLTRFRRRELLRIFLSDVRRLATTAEITEDISNLADAILETALRRAAQEMDNRFGPALLIDDKGRKTAAEFCIVSLGKLGSRELNYSSDIDLLFLYSAEGQSSGSGSRGVVTNREYFIKLSETIVQIVGKQTGEGAAYRVDMRLRPHGRVGPLAISVADAVRYYSGEARDWERQVLIRSRSSAGHPEVYKHFFEMVEPAVFSWNATIETALENVRQSKQRIDVEQRSAVEFNVKLGVGGIREIEFIAQALQLAYGGKDPWLRAPHTLISLSRLADRSLITESELTELFNAYEFLRHLEHVLQMENGVQTHTVPGEFERRSLVARRMRCVDVEGFNSVIKKHTANVHRVFERVFRRGSQNEAQMEGPDALRSFKNGRDPIPLVSDGGSATTEDRAIAPPTDDRIYSRVGSQTKSIPDLREHPTGFEDAANLPDKGAPDALWSRKSYFARLSDALITESDFRHRLGAFRRQWAEMLGHIKSRELTGAIDITSAKRAQTALAEASIDVALDLTRDELSRRHSTPIDKLPIAVIGLGKLGGAAVDYGSDLDLVLVHDDTTAAILPTQTAAEFYGRAAELFVTALSSITRDGSIYRVDLRLRPYGKNGQSVISAAAFVEYMRETAAIWEWLAYVKIRAVAGEIESGIVVERGVREIVHTRAAAADPNELARETRRVRTLLEKEKTGGRRSKDIDIKYGTGGMLDVYFAMRYLQLRDNVPDNSDDRATESMLGRLSHLGSLSPADYESFLLGYRFLSLLDHNLRLTVGRTTRLPVANQKALDIVSHRMNLSSAGDLVEQLTLHRLNIRQAFDNILL